MFGSTAFGGAFGPGDTVDYLLYISGMQFTSVNVQSSANSGSVTATIASQGTGTTVLRAADPDDEGVAVGAGAFGAGRSTHTEVTTTGLAGGWNGFTFCLYCTGTWKAPDIDARTWSYTSAVVFGSGTCGFGGPAGEWSWSWRGAGYNRPNFTPEGAPAYGLFAPIGDDWVYFR